MAPPAEAVGVASRQSLTIDIDSSSDTEYSGTELATSNTAVQVASPASWRGKGRAAEINMRNEGIIEVSDGEDSDAVDASTPPPPSRYQPGRSSHETDRAGRIAGHAIDLDDSDQDSVDEETPPPPSRSQALPSGFASTAGINFAASMKMQKKEHDQSEKVNKRKYRDSDEDDEAVARRLHYEINRFDVQEYTSGPLRGGGDGKHDRRCDSGYGYATDENYIPIASSSKIVDGDTADEDLTDSQLARQLYEEEQKQERERKAQAETDSLYAQTVYHDEQLAERRERERRPEIGRDATESKIAFKVVMNANGETISGDPDADNAAHLELVKRDFARTLDKRMQIVSVTYFVNFELNRRFEAAKDALAVLGRDNTERTLFHGTNDANIESILNDGFWVGGVNGAPVVNGTACGLGVYLAVDPSISQKYCSTLKMFACRAVTGLTSPRAQREVPKPVGQNAFDAYEVGNVVVVRHPDQVVPSQTESENGGNFLLLETGVSPVETAASKTVRTNMSYKEALPNCTFGIDELKEARSDRDAFMPASRRTQLFGFSRDEVH